jgi:hypothetical protein
VLGKISAVGEFRLGLAAITERAISCSLLACASLESRRCCLFLTAAPSFHCPTLSQRAHSAHCEALVHRATAVDSSHAAPPLFSANTRQQRLPQPPWTLFLHLSHSLLPTFSLAPRWELIRLRLVACHRPLIPLHLNIAADQGVTLFDHPLVHSFLPSVIHSPICSSSTQSLFNLVLRVNLLPVDCLLRHQPLCAVHSILRIPLHASTST